MKKYCNGGGAKPIVPLRKKEKTKKHQKNKKTLVRRKREAIISCTYAVLAQNNTKKTKKHQKNTKKPWRVGSVRLLLAVLAQKTPKKKTLVRRKREAIISCTYAVLAR